MVILTDSDKRRLFWGEFCWTLAGAGTFLALLWRVIHLGGPYALP